MHADVVQRADVRVVQRRKRGGFLFETGPRFHIGGQGPAQHLDRDGSVESRIPRSIDFTNSAVANPRLDSVRSDGGPTMLVLRADELVFGDVIPVDHAPSV